jgi:hypothetical protein
MLYSERFVKKFYYEQSSILRDLWMKDVLCTKSDWINWGWNPSTKAGHRDDQGHEEFITIEGVRIKDPANKAIVLFRKVSRFQPCLLDVSNSMIGRIMEIAFEPVAPRA